MSVMSWNKPSTSGPKNKSRKNIGNVAIERAQNKETSNRKQDNIQLITTIFRSNNQQNAWPACTPEEIHRSHGATEQ